MTTDCLGSWDVLVYNFLYICVYHIFEQIAFFTDAECETGWVASNNSCYLVKYEAVTYTAAKSACETQAATLVSIGDADEYNFIKQR